VRRRANGESASRSERIEILRSRLSTCGKALSVQSSHTFTAGSAVFDERNLVSAAGLVPVLELAEQSGLSELIDSHVDLDSTRVASGAARTRSGN